jgi:hypothetical protein
MTTPKQPTPEQMRAARAAGFKNSVAHMDATRQKAYVDSHARQDARRERNITEFQRSILGTK